MVSEHESQVNGHLNEVAITHTGTQKSEEQNCSFNKKVRLADAVPLTPFSSASSTTLELKDLIDRLLPSIYNFIDQGYHSSQKVIQELPVSSLARQLELEFPESPITTDHLMHIIGNIMKYSVNPWNPKFCDKLYASTNPIGVVSEILLAILNANTHVYHVSPVLSQLEVATGRALAELFGYDGEFRGGLTFPGGSASNLVAINTARNLKFPHIKIEGLTPNDKLSVFTSAHSHYSIDKAAIIMGIGSKRVYKVPCCMEGKMIPSKLEEMIQLSLSLGETPFFVNCTSGTTVLGAFDNISEIHKVTKKHELWLHLDGSWGGSAIFSAEHKNLLNGAHLSDSITINPHKLLGVPLQCSFLLLPDRRILPQANSLKADYLFHGRSHDSQDFNGIEYLSECMDLGDGTLACGRRPDAFKMYLAWQYYGTKGLTNRVNLAFDHASYLASRINEHRNFKLVFKPTSVNVCFWYIPDQHLKSTEKIPYLDENMKLDATFLQKLIPNFLGEVTTKIHQGLHSSGSFMLDFSPAIIHPKPTYEPVDVPSFFRMVMNSPEQTNEDLDLLIDLIHTEGKRLFESSTISQ